MDPRRIGALLLEEGLITERDLDAALRYQAEIGALLGQALLRMGALSEDRLLQALSRQLDLPILSRDSLPEDPQIYATAVEALGLSRQWLLHHETAIWFEPEGAMDSESGRPATPASPPHLNVFSRAPLDVAVREALERASPAPVQPVLGSNRLLDSVLAALRSTASSTRESDSLDDAQRLREMAEEAPVIDFVNATFEDALRQRASDIHIEPFENHFQIRFRVDGVLDLIQTLPRQRFDAIASRIKLLSNMDIAERRLPQDGRQSVRFAGQDIDLRVSSLPGAWGESLVLRLLRKQQELPTLTGLGLEGHAMEAFQALIQEPNGVILVTGPTGSGKSTTLYRGLELINDGNRKLITIEDPVEYNMDGVTQVQARSDIGYTFARGLRAILRQDPDVIMIGEIRDGETASIAAQAALTGHLVLSTLHTNSAIAAIDRLIDLGIERFLVSAALRGLIGQRLVRKLCEECAVPARPEEVERGNALIAEARAAGARMPAPRSASWRSATGCSSCGNQGYSGRVALYEVLKLTSSMRSAINAGSETASLMRTAREDGFLTMLEDGLIKAQNGVTSVSEVVRVVGATQNRTAVPSLV